jgi:hypothetical protein
MLQKTKVIIFIFLLSLAISATSVHAESMSGQEIPEKQFPLVKIGLRARPGETLSKSIDVPVKVITPEGKTLLVYEKVVFTITNSIHKPETPATKISDTPLALTTTYLTCSGNLSVSNRFYTSYVDWHYNGASVWHDENGHTTFAAVSPWEKNETYEYTNYPYGPLDSIMTWNTGYFKNPSAGSSSNDASHQVVWVLENDGTCDATGYISYY